MHLKIGFVDILFSYSSNLCNRKNCLTKNGETVLCYFQTWRSVSLENFNDYESAAAKSIKNGDEEYEELLLISVASLRNIQLTASD